MCSFASKNPIYLKLISFPFQTYLSSESWRPLKKIEYKDFDIFYKVSYFHRRKIILRTLSTEAELNI